MATTTAVFKKTKDAGEPLDITRELTASDLIRYTVPAGGPFVTGAPQSNTLVEGAEVLLSPLATIAANTLTDPMTAANVLLFTEVSEGGASLADETSVAEYKVEWGGAAGGSNASSSSPYYAPDDTITLDKDGDYTFDVLPYQRTFSQEDGTATGGVFYLKTSTGTTISTLTFPWKKRDSNESFFPYEGGRQTIYRANMAAGTYRLGFTSHAGAGSGNRVSYEGYAHVIMRRASLVSGDMPLVETATSIIRQRLGVFEEGGDLVAGGTVFDTGLDFTKADRIEFSVGDTGSPGRPWPVAQFDAKELISEREGYVWSLGNAWLTLSLDAAGDEAIGRIRVQSNGRSAKVNAVSTWADAVIGAVGTPPPATLTGNTDASAETVIPYIGAVENGYQVEVQIANGKWLPMNYSDPTTGATHYFQALYNEPSKQFELFNAGSAIQGRPYRVHIYQ